MLTKSENTLRSVIISLFILVMLAGIWFAMSIFGPGMPNSKDHQVYMIKSDGQAVSCFFPFLGSCAKTTDEKSNQPEHSQQPSQ